MSVPLAYMPLPTPTAPTTGDGGTAVAPTTSATPTGSADGSPGTSPGVTGQPNPSRSSGAGDLKQRLAQADEMTASLGQQLGLSLPAASDHYGRVQNVHTVLTALRSAAAKDPTVATIVGRYTAALGELGGKFGVNFGLPVGKAQPPAQLSAADESDRKSLLQQFEAGRAAAKSATSPATSKPSPGSTSAAATTNQATGSANPAASGETTSAARGAGREAASFNIQGFLQALDPDGNGKITKTEAEAVGAQLKTMLPPENIARRVSDAVLGLFKTDSSTLDVKKLEQMLIQKLSPSAERQPSA